ncbi:hypothetical protein HYT84_05015 [Candidatus Micrarchaeota archaeon]|nr:hypothetical protein [Candidatus Micrarchaeota archaeon]
MKALNLFIFMLILTGFFFSAEAKVSTDLKLYFVDIYNKPLVKMEVSVRSLSSDDLIKNITTNERGLITLTESEIPDNNEFYFVIYSPKGSLVYDTKKITFKDTGSSAGFCKYENGKQSHCVVTLDTMHGLNLRDALPSSSINVFVRNKYDQKVNGAEVSMFRSDNNKALEKKKINNDGYATFVFPQDIKVYFSAKAGNTAYTSYNQSNYVYVSATKKACAESFRYPYFCISKSFTEILSEASKSGGEAYTKSAGKFDLLSIDIFVNAVARINEDLATKLKNFFD